MFAVGALYLMFERSIMKRSKSARKSLAVAGDSFSRGILGVQASGYQGLLQTFQLTTLNRSVSSCSQCSSPAPASPHSSLGVASPSARR